MLFTRRRRRSGSGGGAAVTIVSDTFTRADNAASLGSTESGTAGVLAWSPLVGTWGIQTNRAYDVTPAAGDVAVVNSGVADVTVSLVLLGNADFMGLTFRALNATNFCYAYVSGAAIFLRKNVAGVLTTINTAAITAAVSGDTLSVVLSGANMTVKINGATVTTGSDAFNQTQTNHGLYNSAAGALPRWDNFLVTT